ncbi:MAG TPA: threonine synthase, partial [Ruminococcaceae bacterium]|nr:threonine synthase [Oscillospiraceae bacterium]
RYLCDPHTAVAARVFRRYRRETGSRAPGVVVSTASPYKFAPDVLSALKGGAPQNEDAF